MAGAEDFGNRAEFAAIYIIENKTTIRRAAEKLGISKSTVHKDLSERLHDVNPTLWREVRVILDINRAQRHIRGGEATKNKYCKSKIKR